MLGVGMDLMVPDKAPAFLTHSHPWEAQHEVGNFSWQQQVSCLPLSPGMVLFGQGEGSWQNGAAFWVVTFL